MKTAETLGIALVASLLVTGCSSIPPKGGFSDVEAIIAKRLGKDVHWYQGTPEDAEAASRVATLLQGELTLDAAVQIALLNSRSLQIRYEEIGIAQADLVQAGLLGNPVFFTSIRSTGKSSRSTNTELGIARDFLDILLRSSRKRIASVELEEAKLRVAEAVLAHAAEVKTAYYTQQGSLQVAEMLGVIVRAREAAFNLAQRQRVAGTLNELDLASQQGLQEEARIDQAITEAKVFEDRERINQLLSLWGEDTGWVIPAGLPHLPAAEGSLDDLESFAIANRLDLASARLEIEKLARALAVTVKWRWVAVAEVGISTEKDADGLRVSGPSLQIELPFFDQGQARIARLEALNRQSQQAMMSLAIDIRSEVRKLRHRVLTQRRLAEHYEHVLIPVRERIVAEAQRHYNFMLLGAYRLLEAKQDEVDAYRQYIEAIRDYWLARTELELALGGFAYPAGGAPMGEITPLGPVSHEPNDPDETLNHPIHGHQH